MASGWNEIEAAVDAVVFQCFSQDTRLRIQVLLKLGLHMADDGEPAMKRREWERGREGERRPVTLEAVVGFLLQYIKPATA